MNECPSSDLSALHFVDEKKSLHIESRIIDFSTVHVAFRDERRERRIESAGKKTIGKRPSGSCQRSSWTLITDHERWSLIHFSLSLVLWFVQCLFCLHLLSSSILGESSLEFMCDFPSSSCYCVKWSFLLPLRHCVCLLYWTSIGSVGRKKLPEFWEWEREREREQKSQIEREEGEKKGSLSIKSSEFKYHVTLSVTRWDTIAIVVAIQVKVTMSRMTRQRPFDEWRLGVLSLFFPLPMVHLIAAHWEANALPNYSHHLHSQEALVLPFSFSFLSHTHTHSLCSISFLLSLATRVLGHRTKQPTAHETNWLR